jgi:hypothetical protein
MKALRSLFLVALACIAVTSVRATTVIAPTFDELVERAQLIFEGTVTDVRSQWAGEGAQRHIISYVTVRVEDGLKGEAGAIYTLQMLGGTVGDTTMEISDSPKFRPGDRSILFVENNGTQFIPLVGIMHGCFRVQRDSAAADAVVMTSDGEHVGDLAKLGKDAHGDRMMTDHSVVANTDATPALSVTAFKAAIRSKVSELAR